MRLRTILEVIFYTKPGIILAAGIIILTLGLATNNDVIVKSGGAFLVFGAIIGVILVWEFWAWKKVEKRHRENANTS